MNPPDDGCANLNTGVRGGLFMRLAWLVYLTGVAGCCVLLLYSVVFLRVDFLIGAVLAGGIALLARGVLRHGFVDTAEMGEDGVDEEEFAMLEEDCSDEKVSEVRAHGLARLLHEWSRLERTRGSRSFDPWALQSVRHEIRAMVAEDSSLERLFSRRD